ncbi:MAG: cyclic-di-AMP receptor [Anaerolineae bacterium]|nr:cyclic-di-AMP receptor [Anaerolineae bacterium]MEB2286953.1 cyclic-di-AMP receptor [Anaerolineae bacterium]
MTIKLVVVIVRSGDHDTLLRHLLDAGFRVTEFSSLGGFLRRKSATLLAGVPADRLDEALALIRETCPTPPGADEHRATVFVLSAGQLITI